MKTQNALQLQLEVDYKESPKADDFSARPDRPRDKANTTKCWHSILAADRAGKNSVEHYPAASGRFSMNHDPAA